VQPHTIGHFEETFQADAVVFQGGRKKVNFLLLGVFFILSL